MKMLRAFLADESGATAIEYGLIAAGISLAIIAVVNGLGTKLNTKFTSINSSLKYPVSRPGLKRSAWSKPARHLGAAS